MNNSTTIEQAVNHPNHYRIGNREAIDLIQEALGPQGFLDYCAGNVIKYIIRAGGKDSVQQDLLKALKYTEFMATRLDWSDPDCGEVWSDKWIDLNISEPVGVWQKVNILRVLTTTEYKDWYQVLLAHLDNLLVSLGR